MRGEDVFALVFNAVCLLGPLALYVLWRVRLWRRRALIASGRLIEPIARLVGGAISRDAGASAPFVRFDRKGMRGYYLQWYLGTSNIRVTTVELSRGVPDFLEITSPHSRRASNRFPRAREVWYGRYRIWATDPRGAEGLLECEGLGPLVDDLQNTFQAPIRVQLTPGRVTVEVERFLSTEEGLALLERVDGLLALLSTEYKIDVIDVTFDPAKGRCPVCGGAISEPVTCDRCATPHHRDCWRYVGRCALFACGGRGAGWMP